MSKNTHRKTQGKQKKRTKWQKIVAQLLRLAFGVFNFLKRMLIYIKGA
jgi:hypothetical protein